MTTGKLVATALAETFRCGRYHVRMTRAACVSSHAESRRVAKSDRVEGVAATGSRCRRCSIGESHARGIAHEDAPALPAIVPATDLSKPRAKRKCIVCSKVLGAGRYTTCGPACTSASGKTLESAANARWARS